MQIRFKYKIFIYFFAITFPLIYTLENTNLLNTNFYTYIKIFRHLSILLISILGFFLYLKEKQDLKIEILRITFICTILLLLIELIKIFINYNFNILGIYQSIKFLILLNFGYIISRDEIFPTFSNLFIYSFVISLIVLSFLLINSGELIFTDRYQRIRYLFGFRHPGMIAEGLLVLYLYLIYAKKSSKILWRIIILLIMLAIFLTSTRLVILLSMYIFFANLIENLKFNIQTKKFLNFLSYLIITSFFIISLILIRDIESINFFTSGRIKIWINSFEFYFYNSSLLNILFGNNLLYFDNENIVNSIKMSFNNFDNGIFEILLYHGVLGLYIVYKLTLSLYKNENTSFYPYKGPKILNIIIFFCFFEAGFFSPGNFLNVMLAPLLFMNIKFQFGKENS